MKKIIVCFSVVVLSIFFISCRTVPATPDPLYDEGQLLPLDPGAAAYVMIDVNKARPILNELKMVNTNNKQMRQMLDRTQSAAAAFYAQPGTEGQNNPRYRLVSWGVYPSSAAGMALGASKGWKKLRSPVSKEPYWHSAQEGLALAVRSGQAFIASSGSPSGTEAAPAPVQINPFSAQGTSVPEEFAEFRRESVLACWMDKPASVINQKIEAMGLPIEIPADKLFIKVFPAAEEQYQLQFKMWFPSGVQARSLVMVLALMRNLISPNAVSGDAGSIAALASLLLANPPVQDGNKIIISTNSLSAGEIALLFDIFLLL